MSKQNSGRLRIVLIEAASVPNANASVIAAGVEQMRRLVDKPNAVHVSHLSVVSDRNSQRTLVELSVENVNAGIGAAGNDFLAVVGKCQRERSESVDVCVQAETSDVLIGSAVERANVSKTWKKLS